MASILPFPSLTLTLGSHSTQLFQRSSPQYTETNNPVVHLGNALNDQITKLATEMPTCNEMTDELPSSCDAFSTKLTEGFLPASCSGSGDEIAQLICGCKAWDPKSFEHAARPCLKEVCKSNEHQAVKFVSDYAETFKKECDIYVPKIEAFTSAMATATATSTTHSGFGSNPTSTGYGAGTTGAFGGAGPTGTLTTHFGVGPTTTNGANDGIHVINNLGSSVGVNHGNLRPTNPVHHSGSSRVSIAGTLSSLLLVGALLSAL